MWDLEALRKVLLRLMGVCDVIYSDKLACARDPNGYKQDGDEALRRTSADEAFGRFLTKKTERSLLDRSCIFGPAAGELGPCGAFAHASPESTRKVGKHASPFAATWWYVAHEIVNVDLARVLCVHVKNA